MKLLLTSDGITNKTIEKAFWGLLEKDIKNCKAVFIPTAKNIIPKEKNWLSEKVDEYKKTIPITDVVDIAETEKTVWKPVLEKMDIIFLGGGNPFYLNYWIRKSGFVDVLESWGDKLVIGISAGSMVIGKYLAIPSRDESKEYIMDSDQRALGFADFSIIPHLGMVGGKDTRITNEFVKNQSEKFSGTLYALDDNSAIVVDGSKIKVVSEGEWKKFE